MLCHCVLLAVASPDTLRSCEILLRKCVPATAQAVCMAVTEGPGRWQDVPQSSGASVLQAWKYACWVRPHDCMQIPCTAQALQLPQAVMRSVDVH
jgi:hypothetical protein